MQPGRFHTPRVLALRSEPLRRELPDRTQIGTVEVRSSYGGGTTRTFGVFNLVPPPGAPSELGFNAYGAPITFIPHVRQADGEYGLSLAAHNLPQLVDLHGFTLTHLGQPLGDLHNAQRGNCLNEAEPSFGWAKCSIGRPRQNRPTAYLTLPTACAGPLAFAATGDLLAGTGGTASASRYQGHDPRPAAPRSLFEPVASGRVVTNPRASSPSGFNFDLDVDNTGLLTPSRRGALAGRRRRS